jgi:phosphatidylinositol kinase/protein kinase (PI-3  family)
MGGKDSETFKKFVELSCRAFNILRKNASTFISLFAMMLSTGIPELKTYDDIQYLRRAFCLDLPDDQATELFKKLIYESLNTKATQVS